MLTEFSLKSTLTYKSELLTRNKTESSIFHWNFFLVSNVFFIVIKSPFKIEIDNNLFQNVIIYIHENHLGWLPSALSADYTSAPE